MAVHQARARLLAIATRFGTVPIRGMPSRGGGRCANYYPRRRPCWRIWLRLSEATAARIITAWLLHPIDATALLRWRGGMVSAISAVLGNPDDLSEAVSPRTAWTAA
jgi:hypothetical protein